MSMPKNFVFGIPPTKLVRTSRRKIEHLKICANKKVESSHRYFDDLILIHNALPEIDAEKISLRKRFLKRDFTAPIMVSSMTGGHPKTEKVNANIAGSIEELGLAMGVGSQRAALKDPTLERTFKIVREKAPNSFICANIGAQQIKELKKEDVERIVDMVEANAIFIHLNFLQEAVQPEGEVNGEGCLRMIEALCDNVDIPVIIKETGAGISREVCKKLKNLKLGAIDVGGAGGTSFSAVEYYRVLKNQRFSNVGSVFWDWGIPAPASILECREVIDKNIPIIGSGGIRSGLDVAKAIALGADMTGIALPILKPALKGEKDVSMVLKKYIKELKIAMFLTGTEDIDDLNNVPLIIKGELKEYLSLRGIDVKRFAFR